MIVRTQDVKFTIDRKPQPRRVKLGFEGDNAVEQLRFALPDLGEGQTATLMMSGAYANAVTLKADAGRWSVDLTAEVIGKSGEVAAYVRTENGGDIWQSDVILLETGKIPDAEIEIEQRYPTAVGQMLTAMAEHSVEMEEQIKRAEDAADRAEAAGSGGGGTGGADGGYYTPSIKDGYLSFTPSDPSMPEVPGGNVMGPKGEPFTFDDFTEEQLEKLKGDKGEPGKDAPQEAVLFVEQALTEEQQAQARDNVGAASKEEVGKLYEEIADQSEAIEGKQPKGDYALKTDIPAPYTLPVATADTLGGVKVGSDFVMDGETLKAKPENKYELIEEISFAEGCGIAVVDRDITPSGETYAFKEILVTYSYHDINIIKTGSISCRAYSGNKFLELTLGHGPEQISNKDYVANQHAIVEHGKLRVWQNLWSNYAWTGGGINGQPRCLDTQSGVISRIRITRGADAPLDGFVIKIEGVRA